MSFSDLSDLSDLSSSDEDDIPLAQRTSKAKKGPKEYRITHVLRAPRTAQYTAKSLYDQIIENAIDLDPEYQRDVVWQEEKQSGLIDSILRNYYIPPIIFAVTVQDDGSELRTCIDGKQRLTSIQRFIDGQIPHKDSFTNEKLWFKSTATSTRRKLLPQHLRTQFANKQIVCVEYTELNDDQEREIFQRVQLGVALTPAERLQALVGPWSTAIREIQNHVLGEEGFDGYLDWGHARGRDFQCLATIGYLIENHPKTAIPGPKTLEKWLQKTQPVSTQLRIDLHETFRIFVTLARDKKYSGSLNQPTRVSPIEFVMIGVLIYLRRQSLSLTQISSAIEKMRKDVRASHQDIRSNTRVTKHLMEFMAKRIKVSELKSDGEGNKPAAEAIAKTAKPAKRKRPTYSDDSDTDLKTKPAKTPSNLVSTEAIKSSKKKPVSNDQKASNTKGLTAAPDRNTGLAAKPTQKSTTSRTTNNSLSNLSFMPISKPSLPTPAARPSGSGSTPPPSTSNGHANSGCTVTSAARRGSLTILTSTTAKVESPQMSTLNSPASLSAVDRLAPIRAAKASLASGQSTQSSVTKGGELGTIHSPGANISQIPVDLRQNPVVPRPTVYQTISTQQPLPPQPAVSPNLSASLGQGRPVPTQLEDASQTLRSRFPQLNTPAQNMNNDVVSPTISWQNGQTSGTGYHVMPLPRAVNTNNSGYVPRRDSAGTPMPGVVNTNNSGYVPRRDSAGTPQGTYIENTMRAQSNPNQLPRPHTKAPWPPSNPGMSGNVTSQHQPPPNYSAPTSAGMHALPQRPPVFENAPRNSMRAEPLGPPRSASLESGDGRRGSYSMDRHRPLDDRRFNRHDHHDYDRDKRSWSRPRS